MPLERPSQRGVEIMITRLQPAIRIGCIAGDSNMRFENGVRSTLQFWSAFSACVTSNQGITKE